MGFLVTISLHFHLIENVFILRSFLKDIFTGHRIFLWQLFSFRCVYIHHSLSTGFHHFFWKVNCHFTVAFLKGIYFRFFFFIGVITFCYDTLYLFCLRFIGLGEFAVCYLFLVLKDFGKFIFKDFFSSIAPLFYFPFIFILCTSNLYFLFIYFQLTNSLFCCV